MKKIISFVFFGILIISFYFIGKAVDLGSNSKRNTIPHGVPDGYEEALEETIVMSENELVSFIKSGQYNNYDNFYYRPKLLPESAVLMSINPEKNHLAFNYRLEKILFTVPEFKADATEKENYDRWTLQMANEYIFQWYNEYEDGQKSLDSYLKHDEMSTYFKSIKYNGQTYYYMTETITEDNNIKVTSYCFDYLYDNQHFFLRLPAIAPLEELMKYTEVEKVYIDK